MKRTGAVFVAAGLSSRMHEFKPLLPFGDSTVAMHMVKMLRSIGIHPIVVVTGYRAKELEEHLARMDVCFVRNDAYRETEMFDSIMMGLEAIAHACERVLLMPIDTPAVQKYTMQQAMRISAPIVRTMCNGAPGHPILISTEMIPLLGAYKGGRGLRGAMEECGVPITNLEVEDEGIYKDIDTPEQYRELIRWNYERGESYPVRAETKVYLAAGETFFEPEACRLLELIDRTGSVQKACEQMNLSYSKGSRMLKSIDRQLGFPMVERWAGGSGGGGSVLTEDGRRLVTNYRKMADEIQDYTKQAFQNYFGRGFQSLQNSEAEKRTG